MSHSLVAFAAASCLALSLGACVASGQVHSSAAVSAPDLVYINPNVQVIADYDEPIFYDRSYYWRNDGDGWARSTTYTGGWVRVETAPLVIRQIDRPSAYVHYHAQTVNAAARSSAASKEDHGDEAHEHDDDRDDHARKHR